VIVRLLMLYHSTKFRNRSQREILKNAGVISGWMSFILYRPSS